MGDHHDQDQTDHNHEHRSEHRDGDAHDIPVPGNDVGINASNDDVLEAGLLSGRSASVRFNRAADSGLSSNRARMDAANQSLAEALKITYAFLQVGMVVLIVLFVFSGFQKISEGERGISVFLGKPARTNIEPGAHLTWPYPIGEMIRVGEGAIEVPVAREFMPGRAGNASDNQLLDAPLAEFNNNGRLNPANDSMLITADQNIAHAQFRVNFHRSNHLRFVENVLPEQERSIITLAVRRGVVHTMAETTIDDLLKTSAEAIASKVRDISQQTLDDLQTGISIDRIVLVRKTPPLFLLDRFASVQSAAQNAGKAREDALLTRDQALNEIAGRASGVLIEMINAYEGFIELGHAEQAEALLAQIDIVMAGGETNWNGQSTLSLVSGEVSEILNNARAKSSSRVSRAIADLEQFKAKQAQYEANPMLMVARDWSGAMAEFLNKDFVTTIYLPEGRSAELLINPDPDIERARDRERKRREAADNLKRRRDDARQDFFRTQRGIQAEDEP